MVGTGSGHWHLRHPRQWPLTTLLRPSERLLSGRAAAPLREPDRRSWNGAKRRIIHYVRDDRAGLRRNMAASASTWSARTSARSAARRSWPAPRNCSPRRSPDRGRSWRSAGRPWPGQRRRWCGPGSRRTRRRRGARRRPELSLRARRQESSERHPGRSRCNLAPRDALSKARVQRNSHEY